MIRFSLTLALALVPWTQDPTQKLQAVLKDSKVHPSWIYNDLDRGFAEAKKHGKPLAVVFR